jgi:hypothetical protein
MNEQQQKQAISLLWLWLARLEYSDPYVDKKRVKEFLDSLGAAEEQG